MSTNTTQNKLISYFLIVFSLFILLVFTKDLFFEMQAHNDQIATLQKEWEQKNSQRKLLKNLKDTHIKGQEKYDKELKENEIIEYLYGLAADTSTEKGRGIFCNCTNIISRKLFEFVWFSLC